MAGKKAANKPNPKRKKKRGSGLSFISAFAIVLALVFLPTTILLFFGMLPTVVAAVTDRSKKGSRALTVGAMNLAGCTLYLLELWTSSHTAVYALELISDPRNIIAIYCAAGAGYLIDWMMAGVVTTVMVQRSAARLRDIEEEKKKLVERWGAEVTGELQLDPQGFPLEGAEQVLKTPA